MKYEPQKIEEKWKEYWDKKQTFAFDETSLAPLFVIDTPPPYVSADHLHAGHIMSYAQAEFIVRYKRMCGFNVYYPMGFDDNGLPTERFVEKKYNIDKSKTTRADFVKLCLQETQKGAETYRKLWRDLGISVDWNYTYSTIDKHSQKVSQKAFIELYKNGHAYRAEKPVMWCTSCQTTLAQADLEDMERKTKLVYIDVKTDDGEALTFATTRPEMYPSCVGISVNPDDKRYQHIIGQTITMPLTGTKIKVTTDEKIDQKFGSGVVYYCASGDSQFVDWETRHQIDPKDKKYIVNPDGRMNSEAGSYSGLTIAEAREKIIDDLGQINALNKIETTDQVVNVHERCETPIEYISSVQWFIKIAEEKQAWLDMGKKVKWHPLDRRCDYENWVNGLHWDWCVSRQRYYGVPIPVWYDVKTGDVITPSDDELPVDPMTYTPRGYKAKDVIAESDVLDTWATSSISPRIIAELVNNDSMRQKVYPASLRPNAFEIIRTWDFYSIVRGYYNNGNLPFHNIMISGHGLAEDGRKMSKRLGNYIPSEELVDKYGADAIRYWATGAQLGQNLRFNIKEIEVGHRTAVKLYNVARFLQMHIDKSGKEKYEHADIWILTELNNTINKATSAFDKYKFSQARDAVDSFFWSKFTDNYIEFVKYRLFGDNIESSNAAAATLRLVFEAILKLYAPIMPFITEEIYQDLFSKDTSIHKSLWPVLIEIEPELDIQDFQDALKAIEEIRKFKASQNMSLGKELDNYSLKQHINHEKYAKLVAGVMRIHNLTV